MFLNNFLILKGYAKPTALRYLLSHLFELSMTVLIIKVLSEDDIAKYALMLAIVAMIESVNFNVIDKLLFKERLKTRHIWEKFFKTKILGNVLIYSFFISLIYSFSLVTSLFSEFDILLCLLFIVASFARVTTHPVVSLGPIFKINVPFILDTFCQKALPLLVFVFFCLAQEANITTLSISFLFGYGANFFVNLSFCIFFRPKMRSDVRRYDVISFWLSNIPNNLLNNFEKNGVFLCYGIILNTSQVASMFIIYRLVRMLLFANSFVKQIGLFFLSRRQVHWSGSILRLWLMPVKIALFVITFVILGFFGLTYLDPTQINSDNWILLAFLFSATGVFYSNAIIRAQLVVDKRIMRLFIGAVAKSGLLLLSLTLLILIGVDPFKAALISLAVSMFFTPLVNFLLVLER
ncbi:hypothetical protein N9J58_00095 [bacterium]|nr:hypothetical protein [bacterium]